MSDHLFPDGKLAWMEGMIAARKLDNDEYLTVISLTFSRARLCKGATQFYPGNEHWCMETLDEALLAWFMYPALVVGWNRHMLPPDQRQDGLFEWPDGRRGD